VTDWGTSTIAVELAGAATGYAKALTELAGASDYAERAADHMLPGYPGVARSIRQIKQEIEANHHQVTDLAARIPPLTQTVEQVGSDWTPQQVITALAPVADELEWLPRDTLYTANGKLGDTEILIRRRLEGGTPEQLQARVAGPHSILRAVHVRLGRAKDATDTVLAAARDAGGGEQTAATGGGGQEPPDGQPPVPAGVAEPDRPVAVDQLAARLPVRSADDDPVMGFLVTSDGSAIRVRSGKDSDTVSDLKPRYRPVAVDHAEGRAARVMRRDGLAHADLVLNAEPCDYPGVGCRDALPQMLAEGTTLTIWVRDGEGPPRWYGTCRGTGEGIGP
jgi:hypothetical protein